MTFFTFISQHSFIKFPYKVFFYLFFFNLYMLTRASCVFCDDGSLCPYKICYILNTWEDLYDVWSIPFLAEPSTAQYASYAWCLWSIKNCHTLDFLLMWNERSCFRNALGCWTILDRLFVLRIVIVLVESSMRCFFIWKFEWADLYQVIILFLMCMLYMMDTIYTSLC